MKECNKCNIEKPFEDFVKAKDCKNGVTGTCKICNNKKQKKWLESNQGYFKLYALKNKDKRSEYRKEWELKNIEKRKEYFKEYKKNNKEKIKNWEENNKEKRKEYFKKYTENNKEKIKEYKKKYREKNKEKIKEWELKNIEKRKEYFKEYQKKYQKKRRENDPVFKFMSNLRSSIYASFARGTNQFKKRTKTETILGCTIEEFRFHIEKQFKEGMTLENHGKWHLDHIHPVFFAKDENHLIELNHYTNFQPLWAEENLCKGNKIIKKEEN
jgi:hypothetical protein